MRKTYIFFPSLVIFLMIISFSSCSINISHRSEIIPEKQIKTAIENYNKYSINYTFSEDENIPIEGAVRYFIANGINTCEQLRLPTNCNKKNVNIFNEKVVNDYIKSHFNIEIDPAKVNYYDESTKCYIFPNHHIKSSGNVVITNIDLIENDKYKIKTDVFNDVKQNDDFVLTLKQTFVIEFYEPGQFEFISVEKNWELPNYYSQRQ